MSHPLTLRDRPDAPRLRIIGRPVVEDRGAAQHQAAENQQRPHHPAHVSHPHHALGRPDVHPERPVLGGLDWKPSVAVHRALRATRRSRRVEKEQRFVGAHRFGRHPFWSGQVVPGKVTTTLHGHLDARAANHDLMRQVGQRRRGLVGDRLHRDRAPATNGAVRGDQHACVGVGQSLADRFRAEAREQGNGHGAELGARQQGDGVLDHQRQIEAHRHAAPDTDRAEPGRGLLDRVLELRVAERPDRSRLGLTDEREAVRIGPAVAQHGRVIGIEKSTGKPPGEGKARGGIHDRAVGPGPDDAQLLDQRVPEPVRVTRRPFAELRVGRALMLAHEAPQPAALHLLPGG